MPRQLALLLTIGFIVFLFRRESRNGASVSRALWIPLLWVLITGSRFVSQWFSIWGLPLGSGSAQDGSPIDAAVFFVLIIAGMSVLARRQITVAFLAQNNRWITLFFVYCLLAIAWSDFPFVAFKRWIKTLGHPVMALILLTDPNPTLAVRTLIKRAAYVLIPCSILCIKYYPEIGRGFDLWSGQGFNQGVNLNKNELGYVCMLLGLGVFWNLLQARKIENRKARRDELLLSVGFLVMIWWLLSKAGSATSLVCVIIGAAAMVLLGFRWVSKKYVGWYLVTAILVFGAAETLLGVYANVVELLGRNLTLTDRTEVWADALDLVTNPILGAGFESFWLGERLKTLGEKWWWQPTQAHNGYIETYLNLGVIGLVVFAGMIFSTFRKIRHALLRSFEFGRFRMAFFFVILAYNFTEATFKGVSLVWLFWHIIALDYPRKGEPIRDGATPTGLASQVNGHTGRSFVET